VIIAPGETRGSNSLNATPSCRDGSSSGLEHRTQMDSSPQVARVYKLHWKWRIFPVFLLVLGTISTCGLMTGRLQPTRRFGMFSSVTLLVAGAVLTAHAFTAKIILSNDAIELRGFLENGCRLIREIRGRSESIVAGRLGISDSWKLEPKDRRVRTMSVSNSFALDNVFYAWLDRIPAIDDPENPDQDSLVTGSNNET